MRVRSFKVLLVILLLLSLGACGSTTFVYNRLDFLLPWYLDDYVDLTRTQEKYLDELLQPYLRWHREEELSRYLEILDQMEEALDRTVRTDDIEELSVAFKGAWSRLESEGLKWMLALGEQLSDEQIAEFLQQLDKQQQEYEKEYLERSDKQYLEETYDNFVDNFQDNLGRLSAGQKKTVREASIGMARLDSPWLQERADWLIELGTLLRREPGWQLRIQEALSTREESKSPEYQQAFNQNLRLIHYALVTVINTRSEKQDRRLRKKINNFREDLQTLIAQGDS